MSAEHADLWCERCDDTTEHELHYAGRLLESVRCLRCGRHTEMSARALLPAYALDLEHRVVSKPRRLWRRMRRDPRRFFATLPGAVARQPGKFLAEFRELLRRP